MSEDSGAAWQRGYKLEHLRNIADVFRATDKGFVLGAFTGFKERDVAEALSTGSMELLGSAEEGYVAALVWRRARQRQGIKDFTGHVRARMDPGDVHVSRLGCLPGHEQDARALLEALALQEVRAGEALFVTTWLESAQHAAMLEGLPATLVAVKIPASSELVGVWGLARSTADAPRTLEFEPLPEPELWGLRRLNLQTPPELLSAAVGALDRLPAYADHYASYNKRHTWSALSLRGFSDDPAFIVKPAEMSKKWRQENAALLQEHCRDTPLRAALPELEPLIRQIPGQHQRVRLMRLEPGGGELTRHADIVDLEAGTGHRKLLRIHQPLVTNYSVQFRSWDLTGQEYARHMGAGEAWYLDTRKPHTALNGGDTPRIHLVIDAYSSPELLDLLERGGL